MPLLMRSRDFSLLQPVANRSSSPIPSTKNLLFIGLDARALLTRLDLGSHQADLIDGGSLGDIDGLSDSLIFQVGIALDENYTFSPGLEDLLQPRTELNLISVLIVEVHSLVLVDNDHHCTVRLRWRLVFI